MAHTLTVLAHIRLKVLLLLAGLHAPTDAHVDGAVLGLLVLRHAHELELPVELLWRSALEHGVVAILECGLDLGCAHLAHRIVAVVVEVSEVVPDVVHIGKGGGLGEAYSSGRPQAKGALLLAGHETLSAHIISHLLVNSQ